MTDLWCLTLVMDLLCYLYTTVLPKRLIIKLNSSVLFASSGKAVCVLLHILLLIAQSLEHVAGLHGSTLQSTG